MPAKAPAGRAPSSVKESGQLFRRTWGEQVVGNFGMGWAVVLKGIYMAALDRYASTGDAGPFDAGIVGQAFRPKR